MSQNLSFQVSSWLNQLKITVSGNYLKTQLQSHPDYPSLASITDVLDELGIENTAIEIEKGQLPVLPIPFLAHLRSNGGEFVIIKDRNDPEKQFQKFFERWSGAVVLGEKSEGWNHEGNNKWLQRERKKRLRIAASVGLLSGFIIASAIFVWQWKQAVLLLIATAGVFTSWLIVSRDLGIENKIADQVCGKEADCDVIIKSKSSKLPLGISWSDVGIIWFSFLLLSLLINSFTKTTFNLFILLSLLATCSLPFTIFSINYQWRAAKKWCRLCLIAIGLLFAQFIILFPLWQQISAWRLEPNNLIVSCLLLFFVASVWLVVKSLLKINKKLEVENFVSLRFKNNPDIFTALLQKQRKVDVTLFENDLQLGNSDADVQIMVACSPYCGHCANAHKILHELVEKNDIGLTVRFAVKTDNKEDKKLKASQQILKLLQGTSIAQKRRILHDWYQEMNLDSFLQLYSLNEKAKDNIIETIKLHEHWSEEAKIQFTPSIFINGYELPKQYKADDLRQLIRNIEIKEIVAIENSYTSA
jgi:protein-disulfide isomerase